MESCYALGRHGSGKGATSFYEGYERLTKFVIFITSQRFDYAVTEESANLC